MVQEVQTIVHLEKIQYFIILQQLEELMQHLILLLYEVSVEVRSDEDPYMVFSYSKYNLGTDFTVFWVFVSVMVLSVLVDDAHRARAFSTWIYRSDFIFIVPIHPGAFKCLLVDSTALQ